MANGLEFYLKMILFMFLMLFYLKNIQEIIFRFIIQQVFIETIEMKS